MNMNENDPRARIKQKQKQEQYLDFISNPVLNVVHVHVQ
jgi:hypothetical protein